MGERESKTIQNCVTSFMDEPLYSFFLQRTVQTSRRRMPAEKEHFIVVENILGKGLYTLDIFAHNILIKRF